LGEGGAVTPVSEQARRLSNLVRRTGRRLSKADTGTEVPAIALDEAQRVCWEEQGFVVLPQLFGSEQIAQMNDLVDELWKSRRTNDRDLIIDVFIGTPDERRIRFRNAPDDARKVPYKLDDVYLVSEVARSLVLDERLVRVIDELLVGAPIAFNSLTFERGSQQEFHFDTFYMPPSVPNKMCASWIALEDTDDTAGPLVYYPGSHKIPPYYFSDGRLNVTVDELGSFREYIGRELERHELSSVSFPARAGDVFIWHAQLFHGGAPIKDMTRTRRSIVTHYFRTQEMSPEAVIDVGGGRFYLQRPHQQAYE
jgi:ectoine hydroxylase-related dioxygenase (phytanoyl-CoA dioxygenase family)